MAEVTIPKSLAACADMYYKTMQYRLAAQKAVDKLKEQETALAEHLIKNLPKSDATGIAGKLCRVTVKMKSRPQVEDWDKFYAYIVKNYKKNPGVFSLLQRRVGEEAVNEIWSAGKTVPGVVPFNYPKLSYSVNK